MTEHPRPRSVSIVLTGLGTAMPVVEAPSDARRVHPTLETGVDAIVVGAVA